MLLSPSWNVGAEPPRYAVRCGPCGHELRSRTQLIFGWELFVVTNLIIFFDDVDMISQISGLVVHGYLFWLTVNGEYASFRMRISTLTTLPYYF